MNFDPLGPDDIDPDLLDREGNPISMRRFAELCAQPQGRHVAVTAISEDCHVSTVWLGVNHNFLPWGPPLIFETMVFRTGDGDPYDLECRRWSTEGAALAGHDQVVAEVQRALGVPLGGDPRQVLPRRDGHLERRGWHPIEPKWTLQLCVSGVIQDHPASPGITRFIPTRRGDKMPAGDSPTAHLLVVEIAGFRLNGTAANT